jgi:hypothetical protein
MIVNIGFFNVARAHVLRLEFESNIPYKFDQICHKDQITTWTAVLIMYVWSVTIDKDIRNLSLVYLTCMQLDQSCNDK